MLQIFDRPQWKTVAGRSRLSIFCAVSGQCLCGAHRGGAGGPLAPEHRSDEGVCASGREEAGDRFHGTQRDVRR
eukprot:36648-Eustigmatos_ZCMA.PRE.1